MSRFAGIEEFAPSRREDLNLLPIRFERLEADRVVVTNMVGDWLLVTDGELQRIVNLDVRPGDGLYEQACEKLLICRSTDKAWPQVQAMRLRSRMRFLRSATGLHIFVVTLRCEHSCPYCQVSRRSTDAAAYDMDEGDAMKALDIALSAPSPTIKIEFQGGEPLLNFDLIRGVVEAAVSLAPRRGKEVEFVIATNLALLTDDVLGFCREHGIRLSTSLDGPAHLHNRNRPRPGGNSHQLTVDGIQRARAALGHDRISALMTTTEASLHQVEAIIDEYLRLDLGGIFLRPLSPYGFAVKTKWIRKYDAEKWLAFYEHGLRYILKINRSGHSFPEFHSSVLLRRLVSDYPDSYVDLRSPAGIGLGALVYNYDGRVFASDEGRMLAETDDNMFELGHVSDATYKSLVTSDHLVELIGRSLTQCAPQCSTCAFQPYCGSDPVYHYATQADPVGIKPLSGFCARQKGMLKLLLGILDAGDEDAAILRSWAGR